MARVLAEGEIVTLLTVPARDLRLHDVTLGSRLRVVSNSSLAKPGKVFLVLERLSGPHAGTLRSAEWGRGTKIGIHRPEDCDCGAVV